MRGDQKNITLHHFPATNMEIDHTLLGIRNMVFPVARTSTSMSSAGRVSATPRIAPHHVQDPMSVLPAEALCFGKVNDLPTLLGPTRNWR